MLKQIIKLASFFKKNRRNDIANMILKMASPGEPFDAMFAEEDRQGRIYLPYEDSAENDEEQLRARHPLVIEAISYMGYDPERASLKDKYLYPGARSKKNSKIGELFFKRVIKRKITDQFLALNIRVDNKEEIIDKLVNISWKKDLNENITDFFDENIKEEDISKILKIENEIVRLSQQYKNYDSDDQRSNSISDKSKLIVISRNKEDVLNMSTSRNWSSCMSLDGGEYSSELYHEVINGGFVAYLIESDDTNIFRPLSRIWIRRLDGESSGKSIAIPEDRMYGIQDYTFDRIVSNWVSKAQGDIDFDNYVLKGAGYSDTFTESALFSSGVQNLENLDLNDFILNIEKYFKEGEKVFLLKDGTSFGTVMESSEVTNLMGTFSGYKKFKTREEAEFFIAKTSDASKHNLSSIMYEFGKERIIDHAGLIEYDGYVYDEHGEWVAERVQDVNVHDLIPDEEDEAYINEEEDVFNDYGEKIGTKNIFDIDQPYYDYEFEVKKMIQNPKERYELIELTAEEYYDNLPKYSEALFASIDKLITRSKNHNLSAKAIDRIKRMVNSSTKSRFYEGLEESLISKNPNSFYDDYILDFAQKLIRSLDEVAEEYLKVDNFNLRDFKYQGVNNQNYSNSIRNLIHIANATNSQNLYNFISKEISRIFRIIIENKNISEDDKIGAISIITREIKNVSYSSQIKDSGMIITLDSDISNYILDKAEEGKSKPYSMNRYIMAEDFISSRISDPQVFKRIFEVLEAVSIPYTVYSKEGVTKTNLHISIKDEEEHAPLAKVLYPSESLIRNLSINKTLAEYFEENYLDNILRKLRYKIAKKVEVLKREHQEIISDEDWNSDDYESKGEEIRFLKKNFKSEVSAIRDFASKIIDLTK